MALAQSHPGGCHRRAGAARAAFIMAAPPSIRHLAGGGDRLLTALANQMGPIPYAGTGAAVLFRWSPDGMVHWLGVQTAQVRIFSN